MSSPGIGLIEAELNYQISVALVVVDVQPANHIAVLSSCFLPS